MKRAVAEIPGIINPDTLAQNIAELWSNHNTQRRGWLEEKKELRNYIFATDTTKTTNSKLPWKNKTTIPKICQIRDNLHANYMSALFPNDDWLKWEAHDASGALAAKRKAIEAYMKNKVRESGFRETISQLLYDYIDYGNAFYDVEYVTDRHRDPDTNELIAGYTGPKLVRVSPLDQVFNPTAASYDQSYKITRYIKTLGELQADIDSNPEMRYADSVIDRAKNCRSDLSPFSPEDLDKAVGYSIDGFGSLKDYYQSNYVEILEFEGSLHGADGTYYENHVITIIDRAYVARIEPMRSWLGKSTKGHVAWRYRPDNLYGMGPLDNIVGMQYRIDHLENLKADAMDLAVLPPLVIAGNVEEFTYQPGEEILVGEGATITELGKNLNGVIGANTEIATLEAKMEEMAGAPKQAMGIRTPGEKTAFEVQTLEMAASRIFQHKIQNFEVCLVEPALNRMLEMARRNLDGADLVRVMDDDIGVLEFVKITKDDITAAGKLRPIGARHFAAQATLIQNLMGFFNSPLGQDQAVTAHISGKALAYMLEDLLGIERFKLVSENIRVLEMQETQQLVNTAAQHLEETAATPIEPPAQGMPNGA